MQSDLSAWLLYHGLKISIRNWKDSDPQTGQRLHLKTVLWMKPQSGGLCWGFFIIFFVSWSYSYPERAEPPGRWNVSAVGSAPMPKSLIPSRTLPAQQLKGVNTAARSGRKSPNALWYCFSFSVVWSGWMFLVRSKKADFNFWPEVSYSLQDWYLKFTFTFYAHAR